MPTLVAAPLCVPKPWTVDVLWIAVPFIPGAVGLLLAFLSPGFSEAIATANLIVAP